MNYRRRVYTYYFFIIHYYNLRRVLYLIQVDRSGQQMCCFGLCCVFKYLSQPFFFFKLAGFTLKSGYLASLEKAESLAVAPHPSLMQQLAGAE